MTDPVYPGLEGILAGESAICDVDHESGGLRYRGYKIEDLAAHASFEEVAHLLLMGNLPNERARSIFQEMLINARSVPVYLLDFLREIPQEISRMDALRTVVSTLGMEDPDSGSNDHQANLRKAIRLMAQMPALVAALQDPPKKKVADVSSNPPDSHAEYILTLLTAENPDPFFIEVMTASLILYAEHEFNASTFAARVTASSMSDLHSAVTSAIGTLKGPLHGGANEAVMKMLLEIEGHGDAAAYLSEKFAKRERITGFGHRVLKKRDPRSDIMKERSKQLGERKKETKWYRLSTEIEEIMLREKGLYPNLDFYSASAYFLLGLQIPIYTPLFVCSRIAGWSAHVIEQHDNNRLIRPRSRYTGEKDLPFVPITERA